MVIQQVWEESRDYYLDYQKRLIGELLISPVGSIKRRKSWGGWFLYLHKRKGQGFEDIYLGGESDPAVKKIAEKLAAKISAPYNLGGLIVKIAASIGVSFFPQHQTLDDLLKVADHAMYEAKKIKGTMVILAKADQRSAQ